MGQDSISFAFKQRWVNFQENYTKSFQEICWILKLFKEFVKFDTKFFNAQGVRVAWVWNRLTRCALWNKWPKIQPDTRDTFLTTSSKVEVVKKFSKPICQPARQFTDVNLVSGQRYRALEWFWTNSTHKMKKAQTYSRACGSELEKFDCELSLW